MRKAIMLYRIPEWYDSKVPLLAAPALYLFLRREVPFTGASLAELLLLTLFYGVFLGFGYVINDFGDLEADRLAGKKKVMQSMKPQTAAVIVWLTAAAGCILMLALSHTPAMCLALAVIYFFGASYSIRPMRFKERGVLGLLVSSTAQRCFPLLLLMVLEGWVSPDFWLWMLLSFFVGLRYILVHQLLDLENDRKAGVETFSMEHEAAVRRMILAVFIAEIVLVCLLLVPLAVKYPFSMILPAAYLLVSLVRWRGCLVVYGAPGMYSFAQAPMEDFYNQYLILLLDLLLMTVDPRWGFLLVIWALLLLKPAIRRLKFPVIYFRDQIRLLGGRQ